MESQAGSTPQEQAPEQEAPQPPVDQDESSTAPSEDTGGSSPEPGDEDAVEAAPPVAQDPMRPEAGATNPKTAPVPPAFPLGPVEVKPSKGPTATRPSSRIKEAQKRKKEQRAANVAASS